MGVFLCKSEKQSTYDKYSVFISMSGGVSISQEIDPFSLEDSVESNHMPLRPKVLESWNHRQQAAKNARSVLSQYLFALIR